MSDSKKSALLARVRERELYSDHGRPDLWLKELMQDARQLPMIDTIEVYEEALKRYDV